VVQVFLPRDAGRIDYLLHLVTLPHEPPARDLASLQLISFNDKRPTCQLLTIAVPEAGSPGCSVLRAAAAAPHGCATYERQCAIASQHAIVPPPGLAGPPLAPPSPRNAMLKHEPAVPVAGGGSDDRQPLRAAAPTSTNATPGAPADSGGAAALCAGAQREAGAAIGGGARCGGGGTGWVVGDWTGTRWAAIDSSAGGVETHAAVGVGDSGLDLLAMLLSGVE